AWFVKTERGGFAGIFGFMINLGRLGIFNFGPALLAGFTLFGMFRVSPLHWKWLFWGPSILCGIVAVAMAIGVKETPEENGYLPVEDYAGAKPPSTGTLVRAISITVGMLAFAFYIGWLYDNGTIRPMDLGVITIIFIIDIFLVLHVLAERHPPPPVEALASPVVPSAVPPEVVVAPAGTAAPAGYASAVTDAETYVDRTTRADILVALRVIVSNPAVWIVAAAYACTG